MAHLLGSKKPLFNCDASSISLVRLAENESYWNPNDPFQWLSKESDQAIGGIGK